MINVLTVVGALVAWILLYDLFWYVLEAITPLEYRGVPFADIGDHFAELHHRGGSGAEMIVSEQATNRVVRLRKSFRLGRPQIHLDLIIDTLTCGLPDASAAMARLKEAGLTVSYGIKGTHRYGSNVVCHCKDVDAATTAANTIFHDIWKCAPETKYRVRVKGFIRADDKPCHGNLTWAEAHTCWFLPGKPYKRWQVRGGLFYWMGRAAGLVYYRIRDMLFPPRGPGGDLRP